MNRYPVEAKAVGLVQHGRQKLYILSILWSDRNNIIIYRTYDAFKELSKLLSNTFPLEAGLVNKTDRTLPVLKDVPLLSWTRFSSRFLERLRLLEVYSQELLRIDSKISQCEDVISFFTPNNQDLAPSFPQNSLVIMPSENEQKQRVAFSPSDQPTTQPIISEPHLCIDTYETKDTKNRPFKVQKNEQVDVLMKDATGWWLVENEEKCLAWFPAPYLVKPKSRQIDVKEKSFNRGTLYYAQKGYEARNPDEVSLGVGVVVEVVEKSDDGWWLICYNGRFGYAPAMFLKSYNNPHQNLQVPSAHEKFGSTPNLIKAISGDNLNKDLRSEPSEKNFQKARLEKRKSRSLSNLHASDKGASDYSVSSRWKDVMVEWNKQDLESYACPPQTAHPPGSALLHTCEVHVGWTTDTADSEEDRSRKDSGFDEHPSPEIFPASSHGDTPPPIPERPSLQEIYSKCTSITRKAVLQPDI